MRISSARGFLGLLLAFSLVGLIVYAPALSGPFVSDDLHYLVNNPYVTDFSAGQLPELLSPRGDAVPITENFAPLHVLLHALQWRIFGPSVGGHHLLNVLLHALAASLLVLLLRESHLPDPVALFGGAFFLLHPANVEAVAWISQLKSSSSLVLALLALLFFQRRPVLATAAFALALLAKPTAAFALPVAALFAWTRQREGRGGADPGKARWPLWLGVWVVLFAGFAMVEMIAFRHATSLVPPIDPDPWVRVRTSIGLAMRYLVMAGSSCGLSAFHEPEAARSLIDPWWLAGLGSILALGARVLVTLRAGSEEAVWWLWAAISFLPVSQIFPFPFALADRYLYSILPGLIGGALLAAMPLTSRLAPWRPWPGRLAAALAAVLLLAFAVTSHGRARIWQHPALLMVDSARNYPEGIQARLLEASRAASKGDTEGAVRALRRAHERGFNRFERLLSDPGFASLRGDAGFEAVLHDMAGTWLQRLEDWERLSQTELYTVGFAHRTRGEFAAARRAFERALEKGGPIDDLVRSELTRLPDG
jgi:hypothetical protein